MNFELHYSYQNIPAFLLAAIPAALNLALAIYVLIKLPKRLMIGLFVIDLVFTALWQVGSAMIRISGDAYTANFWDDILGPFGLLCSPLILHFSLLFTRKGNNTRFMGLVYFFYFTTFILALLYPKFSTSAFLYDPFWSWVVVRSQNTYSAVLGVLLQIQFFWTIWILSRAWRKAKKGSHQYYQLLLIDMSLIIILMLSFITEGLIPALLKINFPITSTVIGIYPVAAFFALTRYRLFKGHEAINKRELLASISDIVIVINPDLIVSYVNEAGLKKMNVNLRDIDGREMSTILSLPKGSNRDLAELLKSAFSGEKLRNEKLFLHLGNSELMPVLVSTDVLKTTARNEDLLLVCRDVSDLEKAQAEIRKHSAYLEQLFEASPFAIVSLDTQGILLTANPAFEKIFHYRVNMIKGRHFTDIVSDPKQKKELQYSFDRIMEGNLVAHEAERPSKNGEMISVYSVGYRVVIDDLICGAYVLYLDISEQKKAEKEIINKNKELVKINAELDKFVYSASHDIRSPLMTLLGLLNIAENEVLDRQASAYFKMMRESVLKLDAFTMDIIRFSKNIRTDISAENIDIKKTVDEIIETLGFREDMPSIRFETIPAPLFFRIDPQRFYIVMYHLISNAIQFRNSNGKEPYVKISANVNDSRMLEISVADNGEGIEEPHKSKIFEMFSKFSQESKGAGFGLYIVKEIIEKLDGAIDVRSSLGEGSVFTLSVPEAIS